MPTRRRSFALAVVIALSAVVVATCSSGAPAATGVPGTPGEATQVAATPPAASNSVPTTPATKAPVAGTAQVDLRFSGTRAIAAKGTAGRCIIIKRTDGSFSFGFEATEADYAGLGLSYSMANLNGEYVDIKWVIESDVSYGDPPAGGGTLSADHHSVTIDVDLQPFTNVAGTTPGPEHVKGTITCP